MYTTLYGVDNSQLPPHLQIPDARGVGGARPLEAHAVRVGHVPDAQAAVRINYGQERRRGKGPHAERRRKTRGGARAARPAQRRGPRGGRGRGRRHEAQQARGREEWRKEGLVLEWLRLLAPRTGRIPKVMLFCGGIQISHQGRVDVSPLRPELDTLVREQCEGRAKFRAGLTEGP
jgi:hypothetical protein